MTLPLLPGFFLGGFECSTPINRENRRVDEIALTQHDRYVREDYRRLRELGIKTAREAVRWHLIDRGGRLDFASVLPFIDAAEAEDTHVIWDLFHYGYPEDIHPFHRDFIPRFANYCRAFARLVADRSYAVPFYTPVNEISFFAWAATDGDHFAPRLYGRGPDLKRQLVRASIAAMDAILNVDPRARFVHCDPLCYVTAPLDAPELADEAEYFNHRCVHEAWDMLGGYIEPELGGAPRYLDIIGVNYYGYNQWEHQRPDNVLAPEDPRRLPFSELLRRIYDRYRRPLIVTETSSHGELRASWLRDTGMECLHALKSGVDLHGICLYPVIDMFDWHKPGEPLQMGVWDLVRNGAGNLERVLHEPTAVEMGRISQLTGHLLPNWAEETVHRDAPSSEGR